MDPKDIEVSSPPTDGVSSLTFSPTGDFLAAGSWDSQVRVWEVMGNGSTVPKTAVAHDAPDGTKLFSAGASKQGGKLLDVTTGQTMSYAQHDAPISCTAFCEVSGMQNVLVTGSWDKSVKYWDIRQPNAVSSVMLPERCYALSVTSPLMTVATAERHLLVYDLNKPTTVFKNIASPLKCQTKCVANFPNQTGFAVGSIEGRVAIQYVEDKNQALNFSFKCHRDGNNAYPITAISFHPIYGTFSTSGSDGTCNFWDKDSKQRLKTFNNVGQPIAATAFNRNGSIFAYAACYDWSKGHEHQRQDAKPKIYLHAVQDIDIKPRASTKKR